jgi:hypothetical protein
MEEPGVARLFSPRLVSLITELMQEWRRLDERITVLSAEIEALSGLSHDLIITTPRPNIVPEYHRETTCEADDAVGKHERPVGNRGFDRCASAQ